MTSASMQPPPKRHLSGERVRHASQIRKNDLRHILGLMRVAQRQPDGRRIDQINVSADQFAKGRFRLSVRVIRKQCSALRHSPSFIKCRWLKKSDNKVHYLCRRTELHPDANLQEWTKTI